MSFLAEVENNSWSDEAEVKLHAPGFRVVCWFDFLFCCWFSLFFFILFIFLIPFPILLVNKWGGFPFSCIQLLSSETAL